MGKSSQLQQWCEDNLHNLLGFADSALASYLVHIARKAKSSKEIENVLKEGNVKPSSLEEQRSFCQSLFQRSHGGGGSSKSNNVKSPPADAAPASSSRRTNKEWIDKAKDYSLLEEDDDDHDDDDDDDGYDGTNEKRRDSRRQHSKKKSSSSKSRDNGNDGDDSKKVKSSSNTSKRDRLKEKKKRLRTYKDDGDDRSVSSTSSDGGAHGVKKDSIEDRRRRRQKRKRHKRESDSEDDQDSQEGKQKYNSALTPEQRAEMEREKDLRERDAFVQRMLERDQKKTKKVVDEETEEETKETLQKRIDLEERLARGETIVGEDGKELNLERLRMESRRAYLKKRQEREVTLLKKSLEDEEELFRDQKLSASERKRIELGKQIIKMVEKNENQEDQEDGFYRLPGEYDDKDTKGNQDQALLSSRYVEPKHEKSEQELWEESQTRKADITHKKKKKGAEEKEYDLVFDDQIDFVMQETTKGYDKRDKKHRSSTHDKKVKTDEDELSIIKPMTEHEKILEGRKKLPVYPYREEFLAAVKDHQIVVLVGETGSGKYFLYCDAILRT